jgi:hypothetical protein
MALAAVFVPAGAVTIRAEDVTDMRDVFRTAIQSNTFINTDSVPLERGMLVTLDHSNPNGIIRAENDADAFPIGVVTSEYITVGGSGRINTTPGNIAKIRCSEAAVVIGDALVPTDDEPGFACAGGGYAGGLAIESKDEGIIGNVKSLLHFGSWLPTQNNWYLLSGMSEDEVVAAYSFVGRSSEEEALLNINRGTEYALTKTGDTVTWNTKTGFFIPAEAGAGLLNSQLQGLYSSVLTAAFGYNGLDYSSAEDGVAGGVQLNYMRVMCLRALIGNIGGGPYYSHNIINGSVDSYTSKVSLSNVSSAVLSGSWDNPSKMYRNGVSLALSGDYSPIQLFGSEDCGVIRQSVYSQGGVFTTIGFYVTGLVLYNVVLTAEKHIELARKIRGLGGL